MLLIRTMSFLSSQNNNDGNSLGNGGKGIVSVPMGTGHGCNGGHRGPGDEEAMHL